MNTSTELSLEDARLAKRLADTLDRRISEPDPLWDARVAQVIAQAQRQHKRSRWQWSGGLALAASVAFMVALPGDWLIKTSTTDTTQARPATSSSIDGQMLEEIDWLMSMEEVSRDQR